MKRRGIVSLVVLLGICFVLGLSGCNVDTETERFSGAENKVKEIQTAYLTLEYPAEYEDNLDHQEVIGSKCTEEIFYMVKGEVSTELFRICFGDQTVGSPVGYLHTDSGVVPVTVLVNSGVKEMDEETENLYFGMMEGMNMVLECVYGDNRFSEYKDFHPGEQEKAVMKYWTVELPESITWEEITEGDIYQVNFYGEVASKKIKLYSISIGEEKAENSLGTMEIDGKIKTVTVKVDGLSQMNTMSDADQSIAYSMMDTINDVIETIMQSKQFSTETE